MSVTYDPRSISEKCDDRSKHRDFESALQGVQYQLRQARVALLVVEMKLQDTDRPEVELVDLELAQDAAILVSRLQQRVRDILSEVDSEVPVPIQRQTQGSEIEYSGGAK